MGRIEDPEQTAKPPPPAHGLSMGLDGMRQAQGKEHLGPWSAAKCTEFVEGAFRVASLITSHLPPTSQITSHLPPEWGLTTFCLPQPCQKPAEL